MKPLYLRKSAFKAGNERAGHDLGFPMKKYCVNRGKFAAV
jgi:hypothetical protein